MQSFKYSQITSSDLKTLRDIVGSDNLLIERTDLLTYSRDKAMTPYEEWFKLIPEVAILPATSAEVLKVVQLANRRHIPITPRAGGCGFTGNAVPARGGILIDTRRMNKIIEIDEENLLVTAQTGVQIKELDRVLRTHGLMYADEPTSFPSNLLGGRISTNGVSYMNSKYGDPKEQVISLEVVLPYGELVRLGGGRSGKATKSSVGYSLKDLFIGHWGTLGIITEATVRVFPVPEAMEMHEIGFKSFREALLAAQKLVHIGFSFTMLAINDRQRTLTLKKSIAPQIEIEEGLLSFVLMGPKEEIEAVTPRIIRTCIEMGGKDLGSSSEHYDTRHYFDTSFPGIAYGLGIGSGNWQCDEFSFPPSLAVDTFDKFRRILERHGIKDEEIFTYEVFSIFPKASIAIMYKLDERDSSRWSEYMAASREMADVVLSIGGSVSTAHGLGMRRLEEYIQKELGPAFELMLKIKRALDPNNIMNPGKMGLDRAYET